MAKDQIEKIIRKIISVDAEYSIDLEPGPTPNAFNFVNSGNLDPMSRPIVNAFGTIDDIKNECVHAKILLETGDVLSVDNVACRIY